MIQYILWGVSFISLWISLVWLNVLVLEPAHKKQALPKKLPRVTIALPCYNEEKRLAKTIQSISESRYPQALLDVIIVDDRSKDGTFALAKRLQNEYRQLRIRVFRHGRNKGKAAAMNTALRHTTTELYTCLDAETRIHPDALRYLVAHFGEPKLGAVIGAVKVDEPKNMFQQMQRVEYIMSNFIRRMMSHLGTLATAPGGACAMFRTKTLRELGGFDEAGMTEDLEIALRLRNNQYEVCMEPRALTYTATPKSWQALWRQRIRWYRGFLVNHVRYRGILFSRQHGLYGMFQMPLNVLGIILLLLTVLLVTYGQMSDMYELLYRSLTIKGYFLNQVLNFPTLKEFLLSQNVQIVLPVVVASLLGFYLLYLAHRKLNERVLPHAHHIWFYLLVAPCLTTMHWISALVHETFGTRRKW
jgi:cellulose synthase/poly-beta-1,6-N-acetylglucosamine synthase-like glycosyltransferase